MSVRKAGFDWIIIIIIINIIVIIINNFIFFTIIIIIRMFCFSRGKYVAKRLKVRNILILG